MLSISVSWKEVFKTNSLKDTITTYLIIIIRKLLTIAIISPSLYLWLSVRLRAPPVVQMATTQDNSKGNPPPCTFISALTNFLGNLKSEPLSCLNMFGIRLIQNIAQPRNISQKFPKVDISCHMGRHKFSKVAKSYKMLPKVIKGCQKFSKIAKSYPKLPSVSASTQNLPQIAKSSQSS